MKEIKVLIIFLMFGCTASDDSKIIKEAEFRFIGKDILTIVSTDCQNFNDSSWPLQKRIRYTNEATLEKIANYLLNSKVVEGISRIDTRAKLVVKFSDNRTDSMCIDKFYHANHHDKIIMLDSNLITLLEKDWR